MTTSINKKGNCNKYKGIILSSIPKKKMAKILMDQSSFSTKEKGNILEKTVCRKNYKRPKKMFHDRLRRKKVWENLIQRESLRGG